MIDIDDTNNDPSSDITVAKYDTGLDLGIPIHVEEHTHLTHEIRDLEHRS